MKISSILSKSFFLFSFYSLIFLSTPAQGVRGKDLLNDRGESAPVSRDPRFQQQPQRINSANNLRLERHSLINNNNGQPPAKITNDGRGRNNFPPNRRLPNNSSNNRRYGNGIDVNRYHYNNRRPIYSAHNPSWRYRSLPERNAVITAFPFSYQTINYGGYGYRYYNGCYYRPYNNAFIVVAPPPGLLINVLPFGYRTIVVREYPYYYYNGTYYDRYQDNYRVVTPPLGAIVESIPQGYETIVIDGETYYKVDNVQYKPIVLDNGQIWYQVLKVF